MDRIIVLVFLFVCSNGFSTDTFKKDQLRYERVRKAYSEKEQIVKDYLTAVNIDIKELEIYIRAFKYEKKLELWGRNKGDSAYVKIKDFDVCALSGDFGPKRKQYDLQIPEGYYQINIFNPYSNFYLSLGVNYPNKSDRILGEKGNLGGDIYIHGDCVTIGCLPLTNSFIMELYIFCVEAKNNGAKTIPTTFFPAKLNATTYQYLQNQYVDDKDRLDLWEDLKTGYDYFENTHQLPAVKFLTNGRHQIN